MGRYLPCPLPCHSNNNRNQNHHSDPSQIPHHFSDSSSSLSSQPSLPSVPSLTPPNSHHPAAHHHHIAVLKSHSSYVFSIARAGKHLFTGDSNGEIRIWDRNASSLNNNKIIRSCSAVKSIVASGDGNLFTAHQDHKIRVWRIDAHHKNYTLVTTLPTLSDRCTALFSSRSNVTVRRHKRSTWVHHVDTVSALAVSPDGSLLYSVSWDRSFKAWRTSDLKCVESEGNAHDDAINAVVLSDDGFVYTGSADKKIKVWRKRNGEKGHSLISTLVKHKSAVNALALRGDGCVLYSGACDRSIIVWEKDGGGGGSHMAVAGALRGHGKAILCLAVVSDLLCSGSADKTVRIWRRGSGSSYFCLAVLEGHNGPVKCLTAATAATNSDGGNSSDLVNTYMVYSGSLDFDIRVWQIRIS